MASLQDFARNYLTASAPQAAPPVVPDNAPPASIAAPVNTPVNVPVNPPVAAPVPLPSAPVYAPRGTVAVPPGTPGNAAGDTPMGLSPLGPTLDQANAAESPSADGRTIDELREQNKNAWGDARQERDVAVAHKQQAEQNDAELQGQIARDAQPTIDQHAQQEAVDAQALRKQMALDQARQQQSIIKYGASIDELRDKLANQPHDFWGATGANKVSGAIGLILGSIGGMSNGGHNMALEQLNKMREQNLSQQKFEYEMLKGKSEMRHNQYNMFRQQGQDDVAASNSVRSLANSSFESEIKRRMSKFAPQQAQNNANKTLAQIEMDNSKFRQDGAQAALKNNEDIYALNQKNQEMAIARENLKLAKDKEAKEAVDYNPIADVGTAPSPEWSVKNKTIMPRLFETNKGNNLLVEKLKQFLGAKNATEAGVYRHELATAAAQQETGMQSPAEPAIEAAAQRFGSGSTFMFQAGRLRPDSTEARLAATYVAQALQGQIDTLNAAKWNLNPNSQLMQNRAYVKSLGLGGTAADNAEIDAILDKGQAAKRKQEEAQAAARKHLSASDNLNNYFKDGTLPNG